MNKGVYKAAFPLHEGRCFNLSEMQKAADAADISVLFFSAGANFWAILAILGHFWANMDNFGSILGYFGSFLAIFCAIFLAKYASVLF